MNAHIAEARLVDPSGREDVRFAEDQQAVLYWQIKRKVQIGAGDTAT
jgi:hypothetical protein